ncbi:hypothetical protein ITI46_15025 [Streptomyces oryzae]|uniref:Uncharacterized protein n=1 Tax=Streptomyces oryzae TaxID=1434886 RepID=A0ABS3XC61_9ACTN|nr:hypothetical protein [Streptomyces oryzae]MBO8192971.1 hypothetical protein [Streptomyces oryzae]
MATGKVIGSLHRRHRAEEFETFLIEQDQEIPAVKAWLLAHRWNTAQVLPLDEDGRRIYGAFLCVHVMCDPFRVKAIGTLRGVPSLPTSPGGSPSLSSSSG